MTFLWPWVLIVLPLPWLLGRTSGDKDSRQQAIALPPTVADAMAEFAEQPRRSQLTAFNGLWLTWLCLVLAASQPQWTVGDPITQASGRSVMLVVDLSRSMAQRDFALDGLTLDRLQAVKTVVRDFIHHRQGDHIGLILFGDEAFVASPLSFDLAAITYALHESAIGMAGRTTALGDALGLAVVKLQNTAARDKAVILLTDGKNNAGQGNPEQAAKVAGEWGIPVYTIGLGSESADATGHGQNASASLDTQTLKSVAQLSGGRYFRTRTTEELSAVYATLDGMLSDALPAPPLIPRQDLRQPLLVLALISVLALYGIPIYRGKKRP